MTESLSNLIPPGFTISLIFSGGFYTRCVWAGGTYAMFLDFSAM
jgi:hypothetical protein